MYDPYKELGNLISDLDADIAILECMTMNGENDKANSYLMGQSWRYKMRCQMCRRPFWR